MTFSERIIEIKNNRAIVKMLFCFFFRAMITLKIFLEIYCAKSEWTNQINVSKMSVRCQCFFMIL